MAFRRSSFELPHAINWFPGHMAVAQKEMHRKLEHIDMIFEVRDARLPFTSSNPELNTGAYKLKRRLVIFNKADLSNSNMKSRIVEKLKNDGMDCFFSVANKGKNVSKIIEWCLQNSSREFNVAGTMSMVVGMPNVGKSSLINALRTSSSWKKLKEGRRRARVGPTPGITIRNDTIQISRNPALYVVDTPGIMIPKIESNQVGLQLGLIGCIRDEIIGHETLADYMLFLLNQKKSTTYVKALDLPEPTDDIQQVFLAVRQKSGGMGKRMEDQNIMAAKYLLEQFRKGTFGTFTFDPISL